MTDIQYILGLLRQAKSALSEITPQLNQAFMLGTAEGCIGVAINHIESSLPKSMEASNGTSSE